MKGSTMLMKMYDPGVTASFSRPRVSEDNPYSESLFKTLKYRRRDRQSNGTTLNRWPSEPESVLELTNYKPATTLLAGTKTWAENRFEIVVRGNEAKFEQNGALNKFLMETGTKVIVEASPRDAIWGIGLGQNNPDAADPAKWRGSNLLGFALMAVRKKLQKKQ